MRNESGDFYEHVFDEFPKIYSEEMKNVENFFSKLNKILFVGVSIFFESMG